MKKIMILATAAFLVTGIAFAQDKTSDGKTCSKECCKKDSKKCGKDCKGKDDKCKKMTDKKDETKKS